MKNHQTIKEELKALQIQLPQTIMPEMEIPELYFDNFSTNLLHQIHTESFIQALPNNTPYQVPDNYFIQFEDQIKDEIALTSIETLSKVSPYIVEADYFNHLPATLLSKAKQSEPKSAGSNKSGKWLISFSMAATVLLFMGLAFMLLQKHQPRENALASLEEQLSIIPDDDIASYAIKHAGELEQSLDLLPLDESMIDVNGLPNALLEHSLNQLSDEDVAAYNL